MIESYQSQTLPFSKAFIWILLSTILISGTVILGYLYYQSIIEERAQDPRYLIRSLELQSDDAIPVSSDFIAEMLGLSADRQVNIYKFSTSEGREKLLASQLFSRCEVALKLPNTLAIKYKLRAPIAIIADYSDSLIDKEGIAIPRCPLYENVALSKIFLGLNESSGLRWGDQISGEIFELAKQVFQHLATIPFLSVEEIDLSNSFSSNYGTREIVFTIRDLLQKRVLRCSTRNYKAELNKYFAIKERLENKDAIIDLRTPSLGFVSYIQ